MPGPFRRRGDVDNEPAACGLVVSQDAELGLSGELTLKLLAIFRHDLTMSEQGIFRPIPICLVIYDIGVTHQQSASC